MDAVRIDGLDRGVADAAGLGHMVPVDLGAGILGGQDVMAAMAVGAGGCGGVALGHFPAMETQLVGLHRLGEGDVVVAGEELGVRVAGAAGIGQVLLGDLGLVATHDQVGRAVARGAGGGVRHTALLGQSVDALGVGLDLAIVAAGAVHLGDLVGVGQLGDGGMATETANAGMLRGLELHQVHLVAAEAILRAGRRPKEGN